MSMVRNGLDPSPNLPISAPPTMNPVAPSAKTVPHSSTGNISRP